MPDALKDIKISCSDDADANLPVGYKRVEVDLNAGAGGKFIYLLKLIEDIPEEEAISEIFVLSIKGSSNFKTASSGPDITWIRQDLNEGAEGDYMYLGFRKGGVPITEIDAVFGDERNVDIPAGWNKIDLDLNRGAGGKFIYLIYQRLVVEEVVSNPERQTD